jgi:hypothetical protein
VLVGVLVGVTVGVFVGVGVLVGVFVGVGVLVGVFVGVGEGQTEQTPGLYKLDGVLVLVQTLTSDPSETYQEPLDKEGISVAFNVV